MTFWQDRSYLKCQGWHDVTKELQLNKVDLLLKENSKRGKKQRCNTYIESY